MKKHQSILTRVLPLLMVLLTATVLQAAPVSRTTARQAAYSFLQGKGVNLAGPNALTDVSARTNLSNIYIFDCAGVGGYAVVAADNRVKPILSYSQQDNFPQTVPADLQNRLARYDRIVADAVRNNVTPSPEVTNQWQELLGNDNDGSKEDFCPPLTSYWGQGAPFNIRCPFDINGEQYHCKVGSLAVAVAELIYYWYSYAQTFTDVATYPYQYPFFHGSTTYRDANYGTQSADFSGDITPYESIRRYGTPNDQCSFDTVADFLYKVAVGMHTKFGPYESKSTLQSALACLTYHFGYNTTITTSIPGTTPSGIQIYTFPLDSTTDLVTTFWGEFGNGYEQRPVLCEAVNQNNLADTHWFLCDGYREVQLPDGTGNSLYSFHLNWGESGDTVADNEKNNYVIFQIDFNGNATFTPSTSNDTYKLSRIITNLKPKENWFHTNKDIIEIPGAGTTTYNPSVICVYPSSSDGVTVGYIVNGRQVGSPYGRTYHNVYEPDSYFCAGAAGLNLGIPANTTDSVLEHQVTLQDDAVPPNTMVFTLRQPPQYPYDTLIYDNGEFDHAVNNQSSVAQKWGIRIPRSEFEGLGSLTQVMLFTPSVGNYSIYWDTVASDTDRPQVNTNRMAQIRVMQTDTVNIWRTASFTSPINISSSTNYLWIFIDAYDWGNVYIGSWAAVSSRPGTGEYWYKNGNNWQQMSSDYSWMIRPIFLNSSCERPSNFNVWGGGSDGVYPEWVGPRDAIFEIEMGPRGFSHGDSTAYIFRYPHDSTDIAPNISDNDDPNSPTRQYWCDMLDSNGNILMLQPNTSYDFYIRTVCDSANGIYSPWVGLAEPLETDCRPYPIPFYEDFTGGFPQCWEEISMSGILEWLMNSGYWTSNMRLPSGLFPINPQPQPSDGNILPTAGAPADSAMLITPPIDISTADRPVLTFCQRQTSYVATDTNVINIYYRTAEDAAWVLLYRDSIYSYDIDTVILNLPRPNPVECTQYQLGFEIMTDGVLGAVFGSVAVLDSTPRNVITSAYPADAGTTSGDGRYMLADQATVSATANPGYCFDHWEIHSIYGTVTSYQNPLRISVFAHLTCVAIFEPGFSIDIEQVDTRNIAVYPNPTTGRLTLDADDVRSVEVIDMMGRIVYTARETNQLDLGPLPRGAYLLRITLPNDVCVTKINKQ